MTTIKLTVNYSNVSVDQYKSDTVLTVFNINTLYLTLRDFKSKYKIFTVREVIHYLKSSVNSQVVRPKLIYFTSKLNTHLTFHLFLFIQNNRVNIRYIIMFQ